MQTIHIDASKAYDVLIGSGLLADAGKLISSACPKARKAFIVSDDNVWPLYGEKLTASLKPAGFDTSSCVLPHGETSKSMANFEALLERMCEERVSRNDIIVALGGGVIGDLSGFVAASYKRGISYIQVPTTLLASVDSSVGGKTAINLKAGKNQVGSFWQPSLVICDTDCLKTLTEEEYLCGCAEVIKYSILYSEKFFEELKAKPIKDNYEYVIGVCVGMKRDVVAEDEFDTGARMLLNLGHTAGHSIEACSKLQVLHGQAVATGTAIIARACAARGVCSSETRDRILSLLEQYGLPTETGFNADELYEESLSDKKSEGSKLNLIVCESIGSCRAEKIKTEEFKQWLKDGGCK